MTHLLDSNILIDHLRRVPATVELLEGLRAAGPLRSSVVTRAELRAGVRGTSEEVELLVSDIVWEPVTEDIADRAGGFARRFSGSHPGTGLIDYVVAATADVLGLELVTRNVRHFPMFGDLEPPY